MSQSHEGFRGSIAELLGYELLKNFCGRYPLSWYHENAGFAQSGTT